MLMLHFVMTYVHHLLSLYEKWQLGQSAINIYKSTKYFGETNWLFTLHLSPGYHRS